uniref:Uncharacterized protein n=1 Tax=Trichuris muris TaxID=70415 RepID=A0A5S6R3Z2_TRIMR
MLIPLPFVLGDERWRSAVLWELRRVVVQMEDLWLAGNSSCLLAALLWLEAWRQPGSRRQRVPEGRRSTDHGRCRGKVPPRPLSRLGPSNWQVGWLAPCVVVVLIPKLSASPNGH